MNFIGCLYGKYRKTNFIVGFSCLLRLDNYIRTLQLALGDPG